MDHVSPQKRMVTIFLALKDTFSLILGYDKYYYISIDIVYIWVVTFVVDIKLMIGSLIILNGATQLE